MSNLKKWHNWKVCIFLLADTRAQCPVLGDETEILKFNNVDVSFFVIFLVRIHRFRQLKYLKGLGDSTVSQDRKTEVFVRAG